MVSALYIFFIATTLLIVLSLFTRAELRRGERIFASQFRDKLDEILKKIYIGSVTKVRQLIRHTFQLSWYYSLHNALKAVLTILVKIYDSLELVFINNRERARLLRSEKRELIENNHLTEIEAHKVANALSPTQKKKLRAKKLAGD